MRPQVRIAQQNTDTECLVHALAALCGLLDSAAPSVEHSVAGEPSAADGEHLNQVLRLLKRCVRLHPRLRSWLHAALLLLYAITVLTVSMLIWNMWHTVHS